jgi:hypothetical protein
MVDHIYGRVNLLKDVHRPHMFINELNLYIDYLEEKLVNECLLDAKSIKFYKTFSNNLIGGIIYYHELNKVYSLDDSFELLLMDAQKRLHNLTERIELSSLEELAV